MSENLKYSFYSNWKLYFSLLIIGLVIIGLFRNCQPATPATVEITIPATTGKFEAVKPVQTPITKKNNHIVGVNKKVLDKMTDKEREFFQYQLDSLLSLTTAYEKEFIYSDSVKKNNLYKDAIQLKSFNQPFENDKIKINATGLVRGTIEKIGFDYEIKEQKINVEVPTEKETVFRLIAGGGLGINKELNQSTQKINLGYQNKKGNILVGSYQKIGNHEYYTLDYNLSIFNIRK